MILGRSYKHVTAEGGAMKNTKAPFIRYSWLSNRLYIRFDNRLYRVIGVLKINNRLKNTREIRHKSYTVREDNIGNHFTNIVKRFYRLRYQLQIKWSRSVVLWMFQTLATDDVYCLLKRVNTKDLVIYGLYFYGKHRVVDGMLVKRATHV